MANVNHLFSGFSFIALVLVSIPLPIHFKARNVATCLYIFWVSLSNSSLFISSILWNENLADNAPIWCDITSRQALATNVAIPATCLCIQRQIYYSFESPLSISTVLQKRCRLTCELLLCIVLPLLISALAYIFQSVRYDILEDYGCVAVLDNTATCLLLISGTKLCLTVIAGVYSCLNLYHIRKIRLLSKSTSTTIETYTSSNYTRLFLLSGTDMLITVPWNIYGFSTWFPLKAWPGSVAAIHSTWSQIHQIPADNWQPVAPGWELNRWMSVIYGFSFFVFLGLGTEAREYYMSTWSSVTKMFHRHTASVTRKRSNIQMDIGANPSLSSDKFDCLGDSHLEIRGRTPGMLTSFPVVLAPMSFAANFDTSSTLRCSVSSESSIRPISTHSIPDSVSDKVSLKFATVSDSNDSLPTSSQSTHSQGSLDPESRHSILGVTGAERSEFGSRAM